MLFVKTAHVMLLYESSVDNSLVFRKQIVSDSYPRLACISDDFDYDLTANIAPQKSSSKVYAFWAISEVGSTWLSGIRPAFRQRLTECEHCENNTRIARPLLRLD